MLVAEGVQAHVEGAATQAGVDSVEHAAEARGVGVDGGDLPREVRVGWVAQRTRAIAQGGVRHAAHGARDTECRERSARRWVGMDGHEVRAQAGSRAGRDTCDDCVRPETPSPPASGREEQPRVSAPRLDAWQDFSPHAPSTGVAPRNSVAAMRCRPLMPPSMPWPARRSVPPDSTVLVSTRVTRGVPGHDEISMRRMHAVQWGEGMV